MVFFWRLPGGSVLVDVEHWPSCPRVGLGQAWRLGVLGVLCLSAGTLITKGYHNKTGNRHGKLNGGKAENTGSTTQIP